MAATPAHPHRGGLGDSRGRQSTFKLFINLIPADGILRGERISFRRWAPDCLGSPDCHTHDDNVATGSDYDFSESPSGPATEDVIPYF